MSGIKDGDTGDKGHSTEPETEPKTEPETEPKTEPGMPRKTTEGPLVNKLPNGGNVDPNIRNNSRAPSTRILTSLDVKADNKLTFCRKVFSTFVISTTFIKLHKLFALDTDNVDNSLQSAVRTRSKLNTDSSDCFNSNIYVLLSDGKRDNTTGKYASIYTFKHTNEYNTKLFNSKNNTFKSLQLLCNN